MRTGIKKESIWFQTDLDFDNTKENLLKHGRELIGDMSDYQGRLSFKIKDMKGFSIQITTKGKLGIFYPETTMYKTILEKLKPLLVRSDGTQAEKFTVTYTSEGRETSKDLSIFKFTQKGYELALQHSKHIIFGNGSHMGISRYSIGSLLNAYVMSRKEVMPFFSHLRTGYPKIYEKFENCLRILRKRGRFINRITGLKKNTLKVNYTLCSSLVSATFAEKQKLKGIDKELEKALKELADELDTIYKEVESGIPLKGYCDFCPHRKLVIEEK
ncbi:MAG: hypothetical protein QW763_03700 [Archaeoglobaceae archaeon]|nr:hypothetical protein [Candidatus Bathyarchaeota archaeon]